MSDGPPDELPHVGVGMGGSCPNCRAPLELGQEYCLECGAQVASARAKRLSRASRRSTSTARPRPASSIPWTPISIGLIVIAILLVVVVRGGGGGLPATSTSTNNIDDLGTTLPASTSTVPTEPTPTTDTTTTATTPTTTTAATTATTDTTTTAATTSTTASGTDDWTATQPAYTVVFVSMPKSSYQHSDADAKAQTLRDDNLPAGVLDSDNYSSLNPGFWVVYSGEFSSESAAQAHVSELSAAQHYGGYVRRVAR